MLRNPLPPFFRERRLCRLLTAGTLSGGSELVLRGRPKRVAARLNAPPRAAGRFTFPSREAPAASPKAQVVLLGRKRFDLHSFVGDFLRDRLAFNKHNDRITLQAPEVSVNGVSKTLVRASRVLSPGTGQPGCTARLA